MDEAGGLLRINEPDGGLPPRLFLARGVKVTRLWFRGDVPAPTADACRRSARGLRPWDGTEPRASTYAPLRALMGTDPPGSANGPAFRFGDAVMPPMIDEARVIDESSANLLEPHFPYTRSFLAARSPVVALIRDGAVVAACFAARRRGDACEAGVATAARFQGRGFGSAVVAAWRDAVLATGGTPLYSTSWDNAASRALARRLALVPYADTLSLD
jgi:RimJ/RimL family protein N-acetyltransferase